MRRINNEHKVQLLNNGSRKLLKQNQDLENAVRIGEEAEVEARDIKLNLENNTNQLAGIGNNVRRMNDQLSVGSKLIDVMKRHEMKNKFILL
mmetsp:Transcript_10966/g.9699  ORF Transcript_10966/g.9699 Transcript_10966/m.9699 type:complete len:92 (+) Transcript_10966:313-588(+)